MHGQVAEQVQDPNHTDSYNHYQNGMHASIYIEAIPLTDGASDITENFFLRKKHMQVLLSS